MAQDVISKTLGKVSQYNPLSVEKGSCITASNCVFQREGIAENRRGYKLYSSPASSISTFLSGSSVLYSATTAGVLSYDDGAGVFTPVSGTYAPPASSVLRSTQANLNTYITTSSAVYRIDTVSSATALKSAGAPQPTDIEITLASSGSPTGGIIPSTSSGTVFPQVAYRAVIVRYDSNLNAYFSVPAMRQLAMNTVSDTNAYIPTVKVWLPSDVVATDFIQIYRTHILPTATNADTSLDVAGDEMQLCYQVQLTSTNISNSFFSFVDITPDGLLGAALYTNATQEGAAQENGLPPVAFDLASFKGSVFYGNTETKQSLDFSLISVLQLTGKVLRIKDGTNTLDLNFNTTFDATVPQAKVTGSSLTAVNIATTAKSICQAINQYNVLNPGSAFIQAYYTSSSHDLPGEITFSAKAFGQAAFWLEVTDTSIASNFAPQPPTFTNGPASATKSTSTRLKNGLYYSKSDQPESVPALNYFQVGAANKSVLRLASLRDSLIIIKEDGIFRLIGNSPNDFSVTPLDLTITVLSPNSVTVLGNSVYALSNQGVVSISDSGVQIISRDIEPDISKIIQFPNISTYSYGVAYENDRNYILSTIAESGQTSPVISYVYNYLTRQWSTLDYGFTSGIVIPETQLYYFYHATSGVIVKERKDNTSNDYQDLSSTITITSVGATTLIFTSTAIPKAGDLIEQVVSTITYTANIKAITNINNTTYTVTVQGTMPGFIADAATLYAGISMVIKYHPWHGGSPHSLKQGRSVAFFPDPVGIRNTSTRITATFESNFDSGEDLVVIDGSASSWGGAWGSSPWGGGGAQYFPTLITRNKSYFATLTIGFKHQEARERCTICTVGINFEMVSDKVGR